MLSQLNQQLIGILGKTFAMLTRIEIHLAEGNPPIDAKDIGMRFQVLRQLSISRLSRRGDIVSNKLQLLLQPAPDNRVVLVQTHRYRFAVIDFLAHAVTDQAVQLFTCGWTLPSAREADHYRRDVSLRDDDLSRLIVSARREEMIRQKNGRSEKKEMNEWFANKFFHKRNYDFAGVYQMGDV